MISFVTSIDDAIKALESFKEAGAQVVAVQGQSGSLPSMFVDDNVQMEFAYINKDRKIVAYESDDKGQEDGAVSTVVIS